MYASTVSSWSREHSETVSRLIAHAEAWPLLSAAEEVALARRIERGCLVAKERMINSNVRLVISLARPYQGRGLSLGDLVQDGMLGLIRAVEKFDWRRGFRFSTYASLWIRQTIQRGLDNGGRAIRIPTHTAQRARRVARVEQQLIAALGRQPSEEEIAVAAQLSPSALALVREAEIVVTSLDRAVGEDGETALGELLPAQAPSALDELGDDVREQALTRALEALPERHRLVLEQRYEHGSTLAEVARQLGVSAERARQIEEAALRRLAADEQLAELVAA